MPYQLGLLCLGLGCAATVLVLLRKSVVRPLHAAWWLIVACCIGLAGMFPSAVEAVGLALGIGSLSTLIIVIAFVLMLIRILLADLEHNTMLLQQRRMNQHLARLGLRVRQLEQAEAARSAVPFTPVVEKSRPANAIQKHD